MKTKFLLTTISLILLQPLACYSYDHEPDVDPDSTQKGNAEYFQWFGINAGVGYSGVTCVTHRSGIKPKSNTNYGGDGVAVQLKFDGNFAFYDIGLFGLELYGQYNSAKTKNQFYETVTSTTETDRHFSLPWNIGFDLKLGISPMQGNLIFIYGGPDWGYYDFKYSAPTVSDSYRNFRTGGLLGAGLEQILQGKWTLRATFDYRWYGSKTLHYSNGEDQKIKAMLATALFEFGYLF